jgi:hypothetical protein
VALLLLLRAVSDQRRAEHAHADDVEDPRHAGAADLLVDDDLLERPQAGAAVLGGPRDGGEPALGQLLLPRPAGRDGLGVLAPRGRLVLVLVEPCADRLAVRGQLRSVVEVHRSPRIERRCSGGT